MFTRTINVQPCPHNYDRSCVKEVNKLQHIHMCCCCCYLVALKIAIISQCIVYTDRHFKSLLRRWWHRAVVIWCCQVAGPTTYAILWGKKRCRKNRKKTVLVLSVAEITPRIRTRHASDGNKKTQYEDFFFREIILHYTYRRLTRLWLKFKCMM